MNNNKSNEQKDRRDIEERVVEIGSRIPEFTISTPISKPIDISLMTGQPSNNSSNDKKEK